MTIVHEKPSTDYDTFIQDGSILSKVIIVTKIMRIREREDYNASSLNV